MGFLDRIERRLERGVNGLFARAFKAEVQPVELASAIRKAMDDRAVTPSRGHVLVPNIFTVSLSDSDYQRLSEFEEDVVEELVVSAEQHVEDQAYTPAGPIQVTLERTSDLETGFFRVRPSKAKRTDRASGGQDRQPAGYASRASAGSSAGAPVGSAPPRVGQADDRPAKVWSERSASGPDRVIVDAADDFNPYGQNPNDEAYAGSAPAASAAGRGDGGSRRAPSPEGPRTVAPRRTRPGDRPYLAARDDRFLLMAAINVIGRDDSGDIIFDDPGVSRRHAEVRITTDGPHLVATVRDLGSTNGTFVNGERVSSQRLEDGDRVTFGRTTVTYHAGRA